MIPELADDYAAFLKVDITKGLSGARDVVEDMLTRLEEFEGLIQMVQADSFPSLNTITQEVIGRKEELSEMCERIDGLECLVSRVNKDMDTIESLLNTLESESGTSQSVILKTLGSLFSKKPVLELSGRTPSPFNSPNIFSSDKAFLPTDQDAPSSSTSEPGVPR